MLSFGNRIVSFIVFFLLFFLVVICKRGFLPWYDTILRQKWSVSSLHPNIFTLNCACVCATIDSSWRLSVFTLHRFSIWNPIRFFSKSDQAFMRHCFKDNHAIDNCSYLFSLTIKCFATIIQVISFYRALFVQNQSEFCTRACCLPMWRHPIVGLHFIFVVLWYKSYSYPGWEIFWLFLTKKGEHFS